MRRHRTTITYTGPVICRIVLRISKYTTDEILHHARWCTPGGVQGVYTRIQKIVRLSARVSLSQAVMAHATSQHVHAGCQHVHSTRSCRLSTVHVNSSCRLPTRSCRLSTVHAGYQPFMQAVNSSCRLSTRSCRLSTRSCRLSTVRSA